MNLFYKEENFNFFFDLRQIPAITIGKKTLEDKKRFLYEIFDKLLK